MMVIKKKWELAIKIVMVIKKKWKLRDTVIVCGMRVGSL